MDQDILDSRRRVSRRRALAIGGTVGLGSVLAACGISTSDSASSPMESATPSPTATESATASAAAAGDVKAMLDSAGTCVLAVEETAGPYWFDVDSIRSDIREDRPGTPLELGLRVQDISRCSTGGAAAPVANCVVEIWHCDAGGEYSGFESGQGTGPGGSGGGTSSGSYSSGENESATSDDGTYLRGAQATDADGIAKFTTIYPGWYQGRTVHIHLKVHVDKKTVLTTQLYFDEAASDEVYKYAPYTSRKGQRTSNLQDGIYDKTGLVTIAPAKGGYLGVLNLGVDV